MLRGQTGQLRLSQQVKSRGSPPLFLYHVVKTIFHKTLNGEHGLQLSLPRI